LIRTKKYVVLDASCFRESDVGDACRGKNHIDALRYLSECFKRAEECRLRIAFPKLAEEEIKKAFRRLFVSPGKLLYYLWSINKLHFYELEEGEVEGLRQKLGLKEKDAGYLALALKLMEGGRNEVVLCACDAELFTKARSFVKTTALELCP